jgi:hypothetical protein
VAYCGSCGTEMPEGTRFCGRCGSPSQQPAEAGPTAATGESQPAQAAWPPAATGQSQPPQTSWPAGATGQSQPPQAAWPAAQTQSTAASPRQVSFSLSRLRPGGLIAGGGSLLLLITLFLPWYSAHSSPVTRTPSPADIAHVESLVAAICGGSLSCRNSNNPPAISALHGGAGGWRLLILILAIVTIAYLLVRAFLPREPRLPVQHWQLATGLTSVTAVLVLVALLVNPLSALNGFGDTATLGIGAIIGLIAALAAVVGSVLLRPGAPHANQVSA